MTNTIFDVAIIGGGVAGCAAAIWLAQKNYRVIVCEAKSYPHHKVCGEFLSPECTSLLDRLGVTDEIQLAKPAVIRTVAIHTPDGDSWKSQLPGASTGLSRYVLDKLMADQASSCGVVLRESTTVTSIQGQLETGFRLNLRGSKQQETIHARTVIGAHGKRSSFDRILNRPFLNKSQPFIGLKMHFHGTLFPEQIRLYTFPGGYCGLSEIENSLTNVCILVRQDVFEAAASASTSPITSFIDWLKTQNPALGKWLSTAQPVFKSWMSIAQIPFVDKQPVVNGILMAGDSAGLIAPVAGDGMAMALQASDIASNLLHHFLSGDVSAKELCHHYTSEWWNAFRLRLRLSRLLQAILLRPRWLSAGLQLMNGSPILSQFLVTHTRDSSVRVI